MPGELLAPPVRVQLWQEVVGGVAVVLTAARVTASDSFGKVRDRNKRPQPRLVRSHGTFKVIGMIILWQLTREQESIPVGYVPSAAVAVSLWGDLPQCMLGHHPPPEQTPQTRHPHGIRPPGPGPPYQAPREQTPCGQTDTCENITFATSLRTVKNGGVKGIWLQSCSCNAFSGSFILEWKRKRKRHHFQMGS